MAELAGVSTGDEDGARGILPGALCAIEPGLAQLGQMPLHAFDVTIAVQEIAAGLEEITDRPIAGEDLFRVPQIVERDGGDREVEGPSDLLRP